MKGELDAELRKKKPVKRASPPAVPHQVQEELESVFPADHAKQKQLEELKQQLSAKELSWRRKER